MSTTPTNGIDYTNKDYESFRQFMLDELAIRLPAYTDRSQTDAGIVLLELFAKGLDILSYYQDINANDVWLPTLQQRVNALTWSDILGYVPTPATPAQFKQVFVLTAIQATDTTILAGTVVRTVETELESAIYFETIEDLVIPAGKLGNEQTGEIYDYTVTVVEGVSITGDALGVSDGSTSQVFKLNYPTAIVDSVEIYVNEGFGYQQWGKVDFFIDSTATSNDFTVYVDDFDNTFVTFGDGVSGHIPSPTANNIYADYRIGGGTDGNVSSNKICLLDSSIALVDSTFNPSTAFVLGENRESVESIKVNAPAHARTLWRAVTLPDHEDLVKQEFSSQVQFAAAVQNGTDIDQVDLYILTKTGYTLADIEADLTTFFADRQIVGTKIDFLDPVDYTLTLAANLVVESTYVRATVQTAVSDWVVNYFTTGNYDFGKELVLADLEQEVSASVEGVKSFRITSPASDIITPATNQIIKLTAAPTLTTTGGIV
jgi:hypothetical protein